jgi:hypothetical protein
MTSVFEMLPTLREMWMSQPRRYLAEDKKDFRESQTRVRNDTTTPKSQKAAISYVGKTFFYKIIQKVRNLVAFLHSQPHRPKQHDFNRFRQEAFPVIFLLASSIRFVEQLWTPWRPISLPVIVLVFWPVSGFLLAIA